MPSVKKTMCYKKSVCQYTVQGLPQTFQLSDCIGFNFLLKLLILILQPLCQSSPIFYLTYLL